MKKHAVAGVTRKRPMGMTEEAVIDFLTPCRQDVVEVMSHAGFGGFFRKVLFMKTPLKTGGIGKLVEGSAEVSPASVVAPGPAVGFKSQFVHLAVRAIAVEEKFAVQNEPVFVT